MNKPNPLLDFVNFEKIKEKNLMDVNLSTLKELYLTDIKVNIFNVYITYIVKKFIMLISLNYKYIFLFHSMLKNKNQFNNLYPN
jgi:hypothetical protein